MLAASPRMAAVRKKLSTLRGGGGGNKKRPSQSSNSLEGIPPSPGASPPASPVSSPVASPNNTPPQSPKIDEISNAMVPGKAAEEAGVSSPLNIAYNKAIRPKLDVIDKIRPLLKEQGIELPSIVVVGDQSSGKSSVIERLSCVNLPRGSGIVTRCPLVLRLVRDEHCEPHAFISYNREGEQRIEKRINSLDTIGVAIDEATIHLAGSSKSVVNIPIYLRVVSPLVPDLTLIDLPGITRIPVGDQPKDIEQRVKAMIGEYIRGEEAVILCVLPATVDFSTCECIRMGREVDPSGKRMLGVVTKIDQAPKGIRSKLEASGEEYIRLELGFVAVRNRDTTEPRESHMTPSQLNRLEMDFFKSHPELHNMPVGYLGTEELVKRLIDIQMQRIQKTLPAIKDKVQQHIQMLRKDLKTLRPRCSSEAEAHVVFASKASQLQQVFSSIKDAQYDVLVDNDDNPRLHVPARLYAMFSEYRNTLKSRVPDFLSSEYYETIRERVEEARGHSLANFMSHPVFTRCYREGVAVQLMTPSVELLEAVKAYVEEVLHTLTAKIFKDMPRLSAVVKEFVRDLLFASEEHVRGVTEDLVLQEEKVFTLNNNYMDTINVVKAEIQRVRADENPATCDIDENVKRSRQIPEEFIRRCALAVNGEERDLLEMQLSLFSYTRIVLDCISDSVSKALLFHFVHKLSQDLVPALQKLLQEKGSLLEYFTDDPQIVSKRKLKEAQLNILEIAWKELKSI